MRARALKRASLPPSSPFPPRRSSTTLYFGCRHLAARFSYVPIRPYQVYVRRHLALDNNFHRQESGRDLVEVKNLTGVLLHKFKAKIDMMSTEVRQRAGRMSGADERSGPAYCA